MRIIKKQPNEDTIDSADVTYNHIVITKIRGDWYVLLKHPTESQISCAYMLSESDEFPLNPVPLVNFNSLELWLEKSPESHAFNSFKEACEFLITVL